MCRGCGWCGRIPRRRVWGGVLGGGRTCWGTVMAVLRSDVLDGMFVKIIKA